MHSTNHSRGYVDALMTQEVSPPFAEVRELVMSYSGRRKWAYLTRPLAEGALVVALLIAAAMLPTVSRITTRTTANATIMQSYSIASIAWHGNAANIKAIERTEGSIAPISSTDSIATSESLGTQRPIPEKIILHEAASEVPAILPIASSQMEKNPTRWVAYVSDGYGILQLGSPTFAQSLLGSIGLRYGWNGSSSFVLEARRTAFPISRTAQNSTLRDTTMSLDGSSYHNTIGKILTQTTLSTNDVATIDAGYRYEWQPLERWSPFAAILLGANTSGMLSSASVGVRYQLSASYLCDVSARADQFVSKGISPERAFEMEAGIGFAW